MDEKARAIAALWGSQKELVARIDAATSELIVGLSHEIRAASSSEDIRRIAGRWPDRTWRHLASLLQDNIVSWLEISRIVQLHMVGIPVGVERPVSRESYELVMRHIERCQEPHGHWCCGPDVEPTH